MNIVCKLCNNKFKDVHSLSLHLFHSHKNITKEQYYNQFINKISSICICGIKKKFRNLGEGYRQFCSCGCSKIYGKKASYWLNKKQPKELVEKRVQNTDYKKSMETRRDNTIKKYGVKSTSCLQGVKEKIKNSNLGKKIPRTENHQTKIIKAKRKNNTLKHTEQTKEKISKSLNKFHKNNINKIKFLSKAINTKYRTGYYNNIFYRSSYELKFLELCQKYNIQVESAENNKYCSKYEDECGKERTYFPDFYLPEYDIIVEIKPLSMLDYKNNLAKFDSIAKKFSFYLLTEEELFDINEEIFNEYFYT